MSKYHQKIDIDAHNSTSHILKAINQNSTVLEFGSSSGYMTQYMKDFLNCKVNIVEINAKDGEEASVWAETSFIGPEEGDIEKFYWKNKINLYDHIIFSDVLEHIRNPWLILKESINLLKKDGTILISVPNIGHNSVLIDLWNGKFNYRELGLLDNTHIRFFTRESLEKMVSGAGLYLNKEMNTFCAVENTEFLNSLDDIPELVAKHLKKRLDGTLYQFVWELKKIL